jgi:DNA-binding IclR family transcriptional regulator
VSIQSVDRAASLLKEIADSDHPPTVAELAETCGLNRSTTWRLLTTLDSHGLVERDPVSQRYSVGYAFARIAAASEIDPIIRRARPVLERLTEDTAEAASLAVPKRFSLVYVDQVDPPQVITANWRGRSIPLHATSSGKAFLAHLTREERDAALHGRLERFTKTTVTDKRTLERELVSVREHGYAVCVGELEASLFGVSAAVLTPQGRPFVLVSVWGPEHRVPHERLVRMGELTRRAADELQGLLR